MSVTVCNSTNVRSRVQSIDDHFTVCWACDFNATILNSTYVSTKNIGIIPIDRAGLKLLSSHCLREHVWCSDRSWGTNLPYRFEFELPSVFRGEHGVCGQICSNTFDDETMSAEIYNKLSLHFRNKSNNTPLMEFTNKSQSIGCEYFVILIAQRSSQLKTPT